MDFRLRLVASAALAAALSALAPRAVAQAPPVAEFDVSRVERALRLREALRAGLSHVPGEILVKFASTASSTRRASALRVLRTPVSEQRNRWIGDMLHMSGLDVDDTVRAAEDLARQPEVVFAQPNYLARLDSVPNDVGFSQQWNMNLINMPQAWEINPAAGSAVVVAVLDSGLTTRDGTFGFRIWTGAAFGTFGVAVAKAADFDHGRVRQGFDLQTFGGWTSGGSPVIFDAGGHGSHVAGTVAQQTNNVSGFAGVAYGVTLLPIKVCFSPWDVQLFAGFANAPGFASASDSGCDTAAVAEGIRLAADQGAKVINMSLGGPSESPAMLDAIRYAVGKGAFVAIAAGNDALRGNPIAYPAAYAETIDGAMAIAAVTPSLSRALYSNHHSYVEIAAPGGAGSFGSPAEQILQLAPDQSDLSLLRVAPAFNRSQTWGISGTSMASPHIAAVAALLYGQGITNPAAIEATIKRFARDLGSPGRDEDFGYGLVDARASLRGLGVTR